MKHRKIISLALSLIFILSLGTSAFADTWYLENGNISVIADSSGQTVTQGSTSIQDSAPLITQYDSSVSTQNSITIESSGGATANVTIQDINIDLGVNNVSPIDIVGDSSAEITVMGDNKLSLDPDDQVITSDDVAIIHVSESELTMKGDGNLLLNSNTNGAKIGSNNYEDFSGSIHITDNVNISSNSDGTCDGAAIGSGQYGDFAGNVLIDGNANVTAISSDRGAGIGAGEEGDFKGSVTIGGNAVVLAEGTDDSAGIGSGQYGSFSGGTITIKDNATVTAIGADEGPAIGAADDTPMDGIITITAKSSVILTPGADSSSAIGSEGRFAGSGEIRILGSASVTAVDGGVPIPLQIGGDYPYGAISDDPYELKIQINTSTFLNGYSGQDVKDGLAEKDVLIHSPNLIYDDSGLPGNMEPVISEVPETQVSFFIVVDENGSEIPYSCILEDGLLIVTADHAKAALQGNRQALLLLMSYGVEAVRFVTEDTESEFELDELKDYGDPDSMLVLSHIDGVSLTVGNDNADQILG